MTSTLQDHFKDARIAYDEFDVDETHGFFIHSLLLSDWREIEIRFHHLTFKRLGRVYTPMELTEPKDVNWPLEVATA